MFYKNLMAMKYHQFCVHLFFKKILIQLQFQSFDGISKALFSPANVKLFHYVIRNLCF